MTRRLEEPRQALVDPLLEVKPEVATGDGERKRRRRNERNAAAYDDEVCELLQSIDKWRRKSGRSFPAWSEVLQLLKELGWRKVGPVAVPVATTPAVVEPLSGGNRPRDA